MFRMLSVLVLLVSLSGCSSLVNAGRVWGGTRADIRAIALSSKTSSRVLAWLELPVSAVIDTALLPLALLRLPVATIWRCPEFDL